MSGLRLDFFRPDWSRVQVNGRSKRADVEPPRPHEPRRDDPDRRDVGGRDGLRPRRPLRHGRPRRLRRAHEHAERRHEVGRPVVRPLAGVVLAPAVVASAPSRPSASDAPRRPDRRRSPAPPGTSARPRRTPPRPTGRRRRRAAPRARRAAPAPRRSHRTPSRPATSAARAGRRSVPRTIASTIPANATDAVRSLRCAAASGWVPTEACRARWPT